MKTKMRKKLIITYGIVLLILLLIQGLFIHYWYVRTLNDVGNNAMNISISVAKAINIDEYEKLITTKKRNDYFNQMQSYFRNVQMTTGVKYVYVEHQISKTQIEYIFDAEKDSFLEKDDNSTPEAHTTPHSFHTAVDSYSVWGTLITGYSPLINKDGEIIGAVGTDIDVSYFYQELLDNLFSISLYSCGMIALFCFLVYITLSQEIKERKQAQEMLTQSSLSLRNLLNNAGQGFLSFGENLRIDTEYSSECLKIFGYDLKNHLFPDVIFPEDIVQREFLTNVLRDVIKETDHTKQSILLSLLPEEITLDERFIHLDFRIIQTEHKEGSLAIMVILTDFTDKRCLEQQMEDERKILKMIVRVITERNNFIVTIHDYKHFCHNVLQEMLSASTPSHETVYECFRRIHTYKGNFSQLEMPHIEKHLNSLEDKLSELLKEPEDTETRAQLIALMSNAPLMEWLNQELNIINKTLGDWFLTDDIVVIVDETKLIELEEKIKEMFPTTEGQALIIELRRLRYKSFSDLLKPYQSYVLKLSELLEKHIHPMLISGGDILVNPGIYQSFAKTLVHVFRNALDHGIEPMEERIDQGKDEFGLIKCTIKREEDYLTLIISDDGRGININALREKAITKGIIDRETANRLADEKILAYIFHDDFSTNNRPNEISGYGMGLSAVKKELDRLGGYVEVKTKLHEGTALCFSIPIIEA